MSSTISFTNAETVRAAGHGTECADAQHRQVYMDCSTPPFGDKRCARHGADDRPSLFVQGLLGASGRSGTIIRSGLFPWFNDSAVSSARRTSRRPKRCWKLPDSGRGSPLAWTRWTLPKYKTLPF